MDVSLSRRLGGLVGLAVAIAVLWAGPAPAMTGGQLDGVDGVEHHPNVGALLVKVPLDSELRQVCTGSVLSPTEFLTAGHCTDFLAGLGLPREQVPKQIFVSFDSNLRNPPFVGPIDPTTKIPATGWDTHPAFRTDPGEAKAYNDVGVVHLSQPVDPVERPPVTLPAAGFLDAQGAGGGLRGHIFETAGYGVFFINHPVSNPQAFEFKIGARLFTTLPFLSLTPYFLKLQGNTNATSNTTDVDPATGLGGACFGDSGGPIFLTPGDPLQQVQVAVTTAGTPTCESVNEDQRLDTASVLDFLVPFLEPGQGPQP